jgi:hypothetical protein
MNSLLLAGLTGRVPVPPEKRFLISLTDASGCNQLKEVTVAVGTMLPIILFASILSFECASKTNSAKPGNSGLTA